MRLPTFLYNMSRQIIFRWSDITFLNLQMLFLHAFYHWNWQLISVNLFCLQCWIILSRYLKYKFLTKVVYKHWRWETVFFLFFFVALFCLGFFFFLFYLFIYLFIYLFVCGLSWVVSILYSNIVDLLNVKKENINFVTFLVPVKSKLWPETRIFVVRKGEWQSTNKYLKVLLNNGMYFSVIHEAEYEPIWQKDLNALMNHLDVKVCEI